MKQTLKKLPVALISLLLVGYVVATSDWDRVWGLSRQMSLPWLAVFALTAPALVAASVWKWRLLLKVKGFDVSFLSLFGLYVTGQFYNHLLPTSSGGDVVRAELLRRRFHCGHTAYASIVAERFTGLVVLLLLAVTAIASAPSVWSNRAILVAALAGMAFASAVILVVCSRLLRRKAEHWLGGIGPARNLLAKVSEFQEVLWSYARHPGEIKAAFAFSALFYVLAIAGTVLAAESFGVRVSWWAVSVCVSLVLIVTLLPISLNGLGLWEVAFAETFEAMGMTRELGLSVALLLRLRDVTWSVAGFTFLQLWGAARWRVTAEPAVTGTLT